MELAYAFIEVNHRKRIQLVQLAALLELLKFGLKLGLVVFHPSLHDVLERGRTVQLEHLAIKGKNVKDLAVKPALDIATVFLVGLTTGSGSFASPRHD
jgi:hypothetical protein